MRKAKFIKRLTIAIPLEDFEQIKQVTDEEEISLAEFCRDALSEALDNDKMVAETK